MISLLAVRLLILLKDQGSKIMSSTVNDAFYNFNRDFVNLDSERTKTARSSRAWLISQINGLPDKALGFPRLYEEKQVNFGSFSRNTKIRELDDIDLIITLYAGGTTYETIIPGERYLLRPPYSVDNLINLCNDDGTLNSIKVVNKIVSSLGKIDQYKSAEKHRNQEAATMKLTSYEWNFDIVPAFYTDVGFYIIPDGVGGWKATDPRLDSSKTEVINKKHKGQILQIIRTLKYWNRRAMMTTIPSYLFENIILNYFNSRESILDFIDFNLRDFWLYLINGIHYDVPDPKNFQGNLNSLSYSERINISEKAKDAHEKACEAIKLEITDKNQSASIRKWSEIFGPNFT